MNDVTEKTAVERRARTAVIWVGLIVPLAIIGLATAVMVSWLPEMPDPSATHWSGNGPDGFGPPWVNLLVPLVVGVSGILLLTGFALLAPRLPLRQDDRAHGLPRSGFGTTAMMRFLAATSLGLAAMMAVLGIAIMGVQRRLDDAADAPDVGPWAALGFAAMLAAGVLGWFLQPKTPRASAQARSEKREPQSDAPLQIPSGGRAAWFGTSTLSRVAVITLSITVFLCLAFGATLVGFGRAGGWFAVGVGVLMILMLLATSVFHVRADAGGLHVRSALGWPRYEVPVGDMVAVRAVAVNPVAEFGGWGLRWGADGRFGIVLRTGEGIEIVRRNGRIFVVTLDDARTAAAVLSAAAQHTGTEKERP